MFGLLTTLFRSVPHRAACAELIPLDDAWLRKADATGRAAVARRPAARR